MGGLTTRLIVGSIRYIHCWQPSHLAVETLGGGSVVAAAVADLGRSPGGRLWGRWLERLFWSVYIGLCDWDPFSFSNRSAKPLDDSSQGSKPKHTRQHVLLHQSCFRGFSRHYQFTNYCVYCIHHFENFHIKRIKSQHGHYDLVRIIFKMTQRTYTKLKLMLI